MIAGRQTKEVTQVQWFLSHAIQLSADSLDMRNTHQSTVMMPKRAASITWTLLPVGDRIHHVAAVLVDILVKSIARADGIDSNTIFIIILAPMLSPVSVVASCLHQVVQAKQNYGSLPSS